MNKLQFLNQRFRKLWQKGHKYSNPILHMTSAYFCFESIETLGFCRWHSISDVVEQAKILMASVEVEEGLSYLAKLESRERNSTLEQSLAHTIRYFPKTYNGRLCAMQCYIEVKKEGKSLYVRLNTYSTNLSQPKRKKPSMFKKIAIWLFTSLKAILFYIGI